MVNYISDIKKGNDGTLHPYTEKGNRFSYIPKSDYSIKKSIVKKDVNKGISQLLKQDEIETFLGDDGYEFTEIETKNGFLQVPLNDLESLYTIKDKQMQPLKKAGIGLLCAAGIGLSVLLYQNIQQSNIKYQDSNYQVKMSDIDDRGGYDQLNVYNNEKKIVSLNNTTPGNGIIEKINGQDTGSYGSELADIFDNAKNGIENKSDIERIIEISNLVGNN
jgi:hypothetical protein